MATVDRRESASLLTQPMRLVRQQPGYGLAQGLDSAAHALSDINDTIVKNDNVRDIAFTAQRTADDELALNQAFNDAQESAPPDGAGVNAAMQQLLAEQQQKAYDEAPSENARIMLSNQYAQMRTSLGVRAQNFEAYKRGEHTSNQLKQFVSSSATLVQNDPTQYDKTVENLNQHALELARTTNLNPGVISEWRQGALADLNDAKLTGQATVGVQQVYQAGFATGTSPEDAISKGEAAAGEYIKQFTDPDVQKTALAQLDRLISTDTKRTDQVKERLAIQVEKNFGELQNQVTTGAVGIPTIEDAYNKGALGDVNTVGAATRRTRLLDDAARYQDAHAEQDKLAQMVAQGFGVDPKDSKARKAVDQAVLAPDAAGNPPTSEMVMDRAFQYAKSSNVVAPLIQSQMRVGLASSNPQQLVGAAASYRKFTREAPTADTGLSPAQQGTAEFVATLAEYGTSGEEIVRRVQMASQKTDEARLRLKDQFDALYDTPAKSEAALNEQLQTALLQRSFRNPSTWFQASASPTPEMVQEFRYLAKQTYAQIGDDDPKYALGAAANMVISRYQPTHINGDLTMLPYATRWNDNEKANRDDLVATATGAGPVYAAAINPSASGNVHLTPLKLDDPSQITIRPIAPGFDPFKQLQGDDAALRNGTIESQGGVWQVLYNGIPLQHQDGLPVIWQPIKRQANPALQPISLEPGVDDPRMQPLIDHHNYNVSHEGYTKSGKNVSTLKTITIEENGKTVIIPTIWEGKQLSNQDAIRRARASGTHWPTFDTEAEAAAADRKLHRHWKGSY